MLQNKKNINFTKQDHATWSTLFLKQERLREKQIVPEFSRGLELLEITSSGIPNLDEVNDSLFTLTGWTGVYVKGLENQENFYQMLSEKKFPIGSFIRDSKDLSYTPEPDVFHDLYGHLPFYTVPEYADFCEDFGKRAIQYKKFPEIMEEFARFFWYTIEFGLIKATHGPQIFGSGIASSFGECEYALSNKPKVVPFDIETIRCRPFRIDIMQEQLFLIDNRKQLYQSLNQFEKKYLKNKENL